MADEGERVGGIYVDVGINDEGVLARLNAIEQAVVKLGSQTVTVKVKLVEDGSTTPSRAKKTPQVLPATLQVEKDAAKKAVKSLAPVAIPVTLTLANDAVSKLKAQITEAFQNFSIKVNVDYGGSSGRSTAQEEFAEATGLSGGGASRTKRITRSSGPRVQSDQPAFDRFYAVARNSQQLDIARQTLAELKKSPTVTQGLVNRASGLVNTIERRIRVLSATPAGVLPEEQPQAAERPLVERARRQYKRSPLVAKRIIQRPVQAAVMEDQAVVAEQRQAAYIPLPTSTRTGRRYPIQPNDDPALAAIGDAQRRQDRESALLSGRGAGEPSKFAPRDTAYREFDRTSLRGAERSRLRRRSGPLRSYAQDPGAGRRGAGFFEPRPANQVQQYGSQQALGQMDPAAFAIIDAFRRGEYGTAEDPLVEELNQEGLRVGERNPITDPQRRKAVKDAGSTAFGNTFSAGKYRIVNPKTVAKEKLAELGELSPVLQQKIFGTGVETDPEDVRRGLLNNPKYRPGAGSFGAGGYIGVSSGAGGAARSARDTPEERAQSRARIEYDRYLDTMRRVQDENPEYAAAIRANTSTGLGFQAQRIRLEQTPGAQTFPVPRRVSGPRRQMLDQFSEQTSARGVPVAETAALMRASPQEFGFDQKRLTGAFSRYQAGFADRAGLTGVADPFRPGKTKDYLREDQEATPKSVYNAFVQKFLDQYKADFGYKRSAKLKALPESLGALIGAQAAKIKDDTGRVVPDYERFRATGGAGKRFIPGSIEEAAARIEPAGRATTTSRARRRDYGPAESQVAEIRSRLERLEGTPESIRTAVRPGRAGTAEEQRAAKQGGATTVQRRMLGEVDVSRMLLREVQARAARKTKSADEIRSVLSGTLFEDDPSKISKLTKRLGSYGLETPPGTGLPGGAMAGIDVTPAKNIGEARSRLAKALVLQRGYRRMLPASYAAADAERQEQAARGVDLSGAPILSDKTPLTGDELTDKIAGKPTIGRATRGVVRPSMGEEAVVARVMEKAAAEEPVPEHISAIRARADAKVPPAARPAAEEKAAPLSADGGGTGGGKTALGMGPGDVVPVRVVNFAELKGVAIGSTAGPAKASEEKGPSLSKEERAAADAAKAATAENKLRAASQARLISSLQAQGINLDLQKPEPRPFTGKSPARIRAEAEILEARSLSPTRAFQTAVAAAFAKTIGGGGAFEQRVKGLQGSLNRRADAAEDVSDTGRELRATSINLANARKRIVAISDAGQKVPGELRALAEGLETQRHQLIETGVAQRRTRQEATEDVAKRRGSLISPLGVARGFGALGVGAIAGGLIFSAASQAIQAILGTMEEQASKAADALSGFAITAAKVAQELAGAVRSSFGDIRGGISGAVAPSGISLGAFDQLTGRGGLGGRAGAISAAQARVQESDLFRTSRGIGGNQFDAALFQGTGGVLGSQLFAPQPGFLERINADLGAFSSAQPGSQREKQEQKIGAGRFSMPNPRSRQPEPEVATRNIELFNAYIADLNEQLSKVNSNFEVLAGATAEQREAMIKSAESIGRGDDARRLAAEGVAITERGGAGLRGTQFGTAIENLAEGQNQVDPRVAFEQDKRGIEASIRQLYRQRDYALQESMPRQLSLEALAAPAVPVGTGISPRDQRGSAAAGLQEANDLQAELNSRYAQGTQLLKDAIPADLYNSIEATGKAIASVQASISNAQATLQTHEYNNQLFIAKRAYSDILGLQGKSTGQGASQLGILERQNVELSRQSEQLARQLQQRQINFQLATAGFIVAGQSPEERAARIKDAKTQAEFAQRQLDIQKKAANNNIKIFDIQNVNAARDALASIGLLREGRAVNIQTKVAEEKLARLNKLQADNVKKAGKFIEAVEGEAAIAQQEVYKLESAYGKAIHGITTDTIKEFIRFVRATTTALSSMYGSGDRSSNDQIAAGGGADRHAAGALFNTAGATSMIVGEAGTETVAVLRNPRIASMGPTGGGSGGITININNPVVREENDIQKITRSVINALNTRTALLGLR